MEERRRQLLQEENYLKQSDDLDLEEGPKWVYLIKIINRRSNICLLVKIGTTENLRAEISSCLKEESNCIKIVYAIKTLAFKILEKLIKSKFEAIIETEYYTLPAI